MSSWREAPPPRLRIGPLGWLRVGWRGGLIGSVTYGGLLVLLLVRLVEWPLCGQARPVTPWITQAVCRFALWVLGSHHQARGFYERLGGQPVLERQASLSGHAVPETAYGWREPPPDATPRA